MVQLCSPYGEGITCLCDQDKDMMVLRYRNMSFQNKEENDYIHSGAFYPKRREKQHQNQVSKSIMMSAIIVTHS